MKKGPKAPGSGGAKKRTTGAKKDAVEDRNAGNAVNAPKTRPGVDAGVLRRIARRRFVVVLGPLAAAWDGGADPREFFARMQRRIGADLTGLDLTDALVASMGREALEQEMQSLVSTTPGRMHELLLTLRPPYLFSYDVSGMSVAAATAAGVEASVCYTDRDTIREEAPNRLNVVPIMGLAADPETLILTDDDAYGALRKRLERSLAFLKERVSSHEILLIGFAPTDLHLQELLRELGPELKRYEQRTLLFVEPPSDAERALLDRRRGLVVCASAKDASAFLESLPELIEKEMAAAPPEESLKAGEIAERLRNRIHDETRDVETIGISQPEHLEMGKPPTLDEIYVPPSLSMWRPSADEISRDEVDRLVLQCMESGKTVPNIVRDFLEGRMAPGFHRRRKSAPTPSDEGEGGDGKLFDALCEIGYPIRRVSGKPDAAGPLDVVARYAQVVVIGEPASGKSLLLRYIAHFITGHDAGLSDEFKRLVPLIVPLREYFAQRETGLPLVPYLHKRLADLAGEEPGAVNRLFEENRVFMLLDGLDEVPKDEDRRRVAAEIEEIVKVAETEESAKARGGIRFIVTSRPAGYRAARLAESLPHLGVDPFDDGRMEDLLFRWHKRILLKEMKSGSDADALARERQRELLMRLRMLEDLFDLCRNPLMLTIAIFIHHVGLELPERRAEFYGRATEQLTLTWIRAKFRNRIELPRKETLIAALEDLGFHLHRDRPENVIDGESLLQLLMRVFRDREGYGPERARREARELRHLARNLLGIVVERGTDRFGFVHLTFQEYFAARYLALGDGRHLALTMLTGKLYEYRWDQVMRMYLQLAPVDDARRAFDKLLGVRNPFDEHFRPLPRRLADFLSEPNNVSKDQAGRVIKDVIRLADRSPYWPMRADATQRLAAVRGILAHRGGEWLIRRSVDANPEVRLETIAALGALAGADERVRTALLDRLADENPSVRFAAARALGALAGADERVRAALLDRLADETTDVRGVAAQALGVLAEADERVRDALLDRLADEDWSVRQAAARALGAPAGADERVRTALLDRLADENPSVRYRAAEALGALAGADERVRTALLDRLADKNWSVRQVAAEALGALAGADERVRDALLDRLADEYSSVRYVAAKALGALAGTDERVRGALIERAGDRNSNVRRVAARALSRSFTTPTWFEIDRLLREHPERYWEGAFFAYDPLTLDWDFAAEGLVFENGKWVLRTPQRETEQVAGKDGRLPATPDLPGLRRLHRRKNPPAGLDGLKPATTFLLAQYPIVPEKEKQKIRNIAGRWFASGVERAANASEKTLRAAVADLSILAVLLEHLGIAMRDEDDACKKELFDGIRPSIALLHERKLLGEGGVARPLFEALDFLYLYLPEQQKKDLEATLDRWRRDADLPEDHPLRTDPAIDRILRTAKQRRQR